MKPCLHQVFSEFLMMLVMKNYDYGGFSTLFNKLVITFKEYLNKTHSTVPHYTEQFSTLDVLEGINKEASTGRGRPKYNALFTKKQVTHFVSLHSQLDFCTIIVMTLMCTELMIVTCTLTITLVARLYL